MSGSTREILRGGDLLRGTQFADISGRVFREVENHADGDCLYEAVLDSARIWLPSDHELRTEFPGHGSEFRDKNDQRKLRGMLLAFLTTNPSSFGLNYEASLKRLQRNREWGTTDELTIIANRFEVCILFHAEQDRIWTVMTPNMINVNECTSYIVLRNKRSHGSSAVQGRHFVALQEKDSNVSSVPITSLQKQTLTAKKTPPVAPPKTIPPVSTNIRKSKAPIISGHKPLPKKLPKFSQSLMKRPLQKAKALKEIKVRPFSLS